MPQVVPVSDFRANVQSVSQHTDQGEVVILTQNGRPRWAMIDYDEWNASARAQERAYARALRESEEREQAGELARIGENEFRERIEARQVARRAGMS